MSDLLAVGSYTSATGGRGAGVTLLARDPRTGHLASAGTPSPCDSPSFLAAAGRPGTLHAAHEVDEGRVSTRTFDGTAWSVLGEASSGGASPCQLALHPGGGLLVVANYGGSVGVVSVRDGVVGELVQTLTATGGGPVADRQDGSHPHSATFLGDGASLVIADLGTDELRVHAVDVAAGRLGEEPVQVVRTAPGTGPRHTALRDGRLVVVGELDATLTSWAVTGGRLGDPVVRPAVRGRPAGDVWPSEVAVAPWGLVVANRGADVLTLVEVVDGVPRPVRDVPLGARNPRHVAVVGHHLYVSAQDSDVVVHLALDADLAVVDRSAVEVGTPTFVLPL